MWILLRDDGWWRTILFACLCLSLWLSFNLIYLSVFLSLSLTHTLTKTLTHTHTHTYLLFKGHETFRGLGMKCSIQSKAQSALAPAFLLFTQRFQNRRLRRSHWCNTHHGPDIQFYTKQSSKMHACWRLHTTSVLHSTQVRSAFTITLLSSCSCPGLYFILLIF